MSQKVAWVAKTSIIFNRIFKPIVGIIPDWVKRPDLIRECCSWKLNTPRLNWRKCRVQCNITSTCGSQHCITVHITSRFFTDCQYGYSTALESWATLQDNSVEFVDGSSFEILSIQSVLLTPTLVS